MKPSVRIIIMGPPGAGKGTLSATILEHFSVKHLATGDMLRAMVQSGHPLGKQCSEIMEKGGLVDDELVVNIIEQNLLQLAAGVGFMLDGFPRTIKQAELLDQLLARIGSKIDSVIELHADDALLVKRVTGRLLHKSSGRIYHEVTKPPKVPMVDDVTGEPLEKRSDDTEALLLTRLETFRAQTVPVVEYYKTQGLHKLVDGARAEGEVFKDVQGILAPLAKQ